MRLDRRIAILAAALLSQAAVAFPIYVPPPTATEFVNIRTNRYVLIRDPAERAAVMAGAAGPGWRPTGYTFVVGDPDSNEIIDGNVCRFFNPATVSHFHTASAAECSYLRNNAIGYIFEKIDFSVPLRFDGGSCPGHSPDEIYRLYNNRGAFGEATHRYSGNREIID